MACPDSNQSVDGCYCRNCNYQRCTRKLVREEWIAIAGGRYRGRWWFFDLHALKCIIITVGANGFGAVTVFNWKRYREGASSTIAITGSTDRAIVSAVTSAAPWFHSVFPQRLYRTRKSPGTVEFNPKLHLITIYTAHRERETKREICRFNIQINLMLSV